MRLSSKCPSARPHGTTRLPVDGFWWNLIFEIFSTICSEKSSFTKIRPEKGVPYVKTFSHLWQYISEFFLKWEKFLENSCREKENINFMFNNFFFENSAVYVEKYCRARGVINYVTIWRIRFACWISKATCKHAHTHAHALRHTQDSARAHT